ncbi:hypothetical protein EV175_000336 [Coemansia sp. RSA 1933]|nr:hypothetical protein EV175_000336 [Coemansia sp. RSA 1933]
MYIPASPTSTSSFVQQHLATSAAPSTYTSTVAVENRNSYRNPAFSLRLQSGGRNVVLGQKKRPLPIYTPPAVIRKDSGEVVRPCLRKRSATTNDLAELQTTTSSSGDQSPIPAGMRTPRFVHFGADLEYVRWFLKAQSPRSASQDAVPDYFSASEDEHNQPALPQTAQAADTKPATVRLTSVRRPSPSFTIFEESPVVMERVELADNRRSSAALRGTIKVHNIAFEKCVSVRYSFDQWRTAEETSASYIRTLLDSQGSRPGVDRFVFAIALPPSLLAASLPATVALCVRYSVAGAEHWDNNSGSNYIFKIAQPAVPAIVDDEADYDGIMISSNNGTSQPSSSLVDLRAPRCLSFGSSDAVCSFRAPTPADTRRYMEHSAALFGLSSRKQQSSGNGSRSPQVTPLLQGGSSQLPASGADAAAGIRYDNCRRRALSLPSISSSPRMHTEQPLCLPRHAQQLPLYQEVAWRDEGEDLLPCTASSSALQNAGIVTSARFAGKAVESFCLPPPASSGSSSSSSPLVSSSENNAAAAAAGGGHQAVTSSSSPSLHHTSMMRTGSPLGHVVFDADGSMRANSPLVWSHSSTATSVLQC